MQFRHQLDHQQNYCIYREATCPKFKATMFLLELGKHEKEECPRRIVNCSIHNCDESMPFEEREEHKTKVCVANSVQVTIVMNSLVLLVSKRYFYENNLCPHRTCRLSFNLWVIKDSVRVRHGL